MSATVLPFKGKAVNLPQNVSAYEIRNAYIAKIQRPPTPEDESIIQMLIENAERDIADPGWRERKKAEEKKWREDLEQRRNQPLVNMVRGQVRALEFMIAWDELEDWIKEQPEGCQIRERWNYIDWQFAGEVYAVAKSIPELR